ncbi:hypothetical protein SDC9_135320 [bioreactor metagenome]|uniref:Uncharacterized protein n=1 Tax=bioreactor metagenome TaxID=1076179 RepID=A0A645DG14_9ZZZZ
MAVHQGVAVVRVQIGNGAQQQAFARAGMPHDRDAFACRHGKVDGADVQVLQLL